ncbi:substrate-binding domain-containing protein [Mycolicibacterium sp.]|uniref:substrate-binding domain-containing protein n=1 Tax=Mycolicibacterium sp. TaxID=2320850 RepID=UPI0037C7C9C0
MRFARIAAAAAVVVVAGGCHATNSGADGTYTVGVTTLFPTGTFSEFVDRLNEIGPAQGISFDIADINNDVSKEHEVLSAFATKGVDLVVTSVASATGSAAAIRRLDNADVPVVCYNTCLAPPLDEQLTEAFVTNDQKGLGTSTGRAVAAHLEGRHKPAKVAYLTCETYDVCKARRAGLDEALSGLDVQTVSAQEGYVVDAATPVATAMLAAHPDIDVLIAENEDGIVAAAKAVEARGLQGRVAVFGIGMNPTVAQLLLAEPAVVEHTTGQDAAAWADEVVAVAIATRDGTGAGDYLHFTPSPEFSRENLAAVKQYLAAHQ